MFRGVAKATGIFGSNKKGSKDGSGPANADSAEGESDGGDGSNPISPVTPNSGNATTPKQSKPSMMNRMFSSQKKLILEPPTANPGKGAAFIDGSLSPIPREDEEPRDKNSRSSSNDGNAKISSSGPSKTDAQMRPAIGRSQSTNSSSSSSYNNNSNNNNNGGAELAQLRQQLIIEQQVSDEFKRKYQETEATLTDTQTKLTDAEEKVAKYKKDRKEILAAFKKTEEELDRVTELMNASADECESLKQELVSGEFCFV